MYAVRVNGVVSLLNPLHYVDSFARVQMELRAALVPLASMTTATTTPAMIYVSDTKQIPLQSLAVNLWKKKISLKIYF